MKTINIKMNSNQEWFNKEKILDLKEFEKVEKKFEYYILSKYLYELNTRDNQQRLKDDFDIFVRSYFHKLNMDISFSDIASLYISENGIFVAPFSSVAGMVFFTDIRKKYWDEFIKLCNLRQKEKLLEFN